MKEQDVYVGQICVVKEDVWREWCVRTQVDYKPFVPQPITQLPGNSPYSGYVMLAFPFWWWKLEELDISDNVIRSKFLDKINATAEILRIMNIADVNVTEEARNKILNVISEIVYKSESDTKEWAAKVCERMVVGGRAWTEEQQIAADALFAAPKNIRE